MNGIAKSRLSPGFSRALLPPLLAMLAACSPGGTAPPLQGAAIGGPIALTDQNGRSFGDAQLEGRYRIVYFGFTHCPDVCPTDLAQIGQALRRFETEDPARAARVQPLFVTVDPERDTPAVLKEYAAKLGADEARWHFLTGPADAMFAAAKGMNLAAGPATADAPIFHSDIFVLIDGEGKVRGIYRNSDADTLEKLAGDARTLLGSDDSHGSAGAKS